jgi:hypothetical protein
VVGVFDNDLYVEHGSTALGRIFPMAAHPAASVPAFKKTRLEKQTDRIEELTTKLALPRAALTGHPEVAPLDGGDQKVVSTAFADPDPFQEFHFPNALAPSEQSQTP